MTGLRFCTLDAVTSSSPPPSIIEVLATVVAVLARRAAGAIATGCRRVVIDAPRTLVTSLARASRRARPLVIALVRSLARRLARRRHLFGALVRRALLAGAMIVLAVAGGSLVAARQVALIPSSPEVFFAAFAVCGGICIAAPERRLRLGGLAVGSLHGVFAALTWFGTH